MTQIPDAARAADRAAPAGTPAAIFSATDPEAFGAGATPTHGSRLILRGRGRFEGRRERLLLGATVLNRGRVSLPATFHNDVGERAVFSLVAGAPGGGRGQGPAVQGRPLGPDMMVWWRSGAEIHTRWPADLPWWNLITPLPRFEEALRALLGAPLLAPHGSAAFIPLAPGVRERLDAAFAAALVTPAVDGRRLEGDLLALLAAALGPAGEDVAEAPRARRLAIVDGLVAIADRTEAQPPLTEVCAELGVPLRTLNAAAAAVLGVSAAAYLRARRLNRAFHDLVSGAVASVTEAATRHGFWEFGRFAVTYRAAFGEAPSATLRRARGMAGAPS